MKEGKVIVWGVFTNSLGKKRRERQGRKERYTQLNAEFENSKERQGSLLKWTMQRHRGKQ